MPLPKSYLKASNQDLNHRFKGTIIEYNGSPILVINVSATNNFTVLVFDEEKKGVAKKTIKLDDPGLNITGLGRRLGLFSFGDGWVGRLSRTPLKGMSQGLCLSNTSFLGYRNNTLYDFYANSSGIRYPGTQGTGWSTPFNEIERDYIQNIGSNYNVRYEIVAPFLCEGFHKMWRNQEDSYPKVTESFLKSMGPAIPISKNFIAEKDAFDQRYLVAKGKRVGLIINGRVKYLPEKAYLAQEVERATGLQAA